MKLLIDIPKEFEQDFQEDRFNDSLHRLSADAHLLAGLYEQEIALMLSEAFKNAVPIPPHGDLIDRSCLCDDSIGGDYGSGIRVYYAYEVEHAPVIIPAEKGE